MLPLKTILIHRLNFVARGIDGQINDHLNGIEIDEEEEQITRTTNLPDNIYYLEHITPLYKICNQWLVKLSRGLESKIAKDRLLLNGLNHPIDILPTYNHPGFLDVDFPPPNSKWWSDVLDTLSPKVTILRDGMLSTIYAKDLVVGDILYVTGGSRIHADIRVIIADQSVAESYLEKIPRKYNVSENYTNPDPRYTDNLLPYSSVLLCGHLFGIVVRVGKRTLHYLLSKEYPLIESNINVSKSHTKKLKVHFQHLCEHLIVPKTMACIDNIHKIRYIIITLVDLHSDDLVQALEICRQLKIRILIINHDSFIDSSLQQLIPFQDNIPFTDSSVSSFINEWLYRDTPIEGILLSPDMLITVINSITNNIKRHDFTKLNSIRDDNHYKTQIAFVGGTYVEHLNVITNVGISFSFLSAVELFKSQCDGLLLTNLITEFIDSYRTLLEIGDQSKYCLIY